MNHLGSLTASALLASLWWTNAFPGEQGHTRVLVDKADVEKLRARCRQEPYTFMLRSIEKQMNKPAEEAKSLMYDNRPLNLASLYLLTGEAKYAAEAEKLCVAMVNDKEFWNNPDSKGLTRCAGALRVALAHDACCDAWGEADRKLVSGQLLVAAQNIMKSMGQSANTKLANNWQAVRYGGAGLAALACDESGREDIARQAYVKLKAHLNANLGENGWNPEGIGYTQYPWQFTGPFGIAAARAGIGDLRTEVKKAARTFWTTYAGTVSIPRPGDDGPAFGLRADLSDDHPSWSGEGTAGMAFWYAPKEQLPALKWMYDYLVGAKGDGCWDSRAGGGLYSVLYYPADTQAQNPAGPVGLDFADTSHGIVIFRNRFQDENDIVAAVNAHSRQPDGCHGGPDTNTIRILGLGSCFVVGGGRTGDTNGQTNLFPGAPPAKAPGGLGKLISHEFTKDGGGQTVASGSCMGVIEHKRVFATDFSGRCGAPALFVDAETSQNGKRWRLSTPEFNHVAVNGSGFTIKSPVGSSLACTVLEPQKTVFRQGTVERGGGAGHAGFPYRDKKYVNNKWIELDCDKNVLVVMTLQEPGKAAPAVTGGGSAARAELKVGALAVQVGADKVTFVP